MSEQSPEAGPERTGWLDDPRNVTRIVRGLYVACALVLVAELFIHRHAYFGVEGWFGFYAALGFLAYVGIVNAAKLLRRALGRPESYYLSEADRDGGRRDG